MFKHARIPIHAIPLANNTRLRAGNVETLPAAKLMAANSRVPNTTNPSTDNLLRNRGSAAAPAKAPKPKDPINSPYPVAPWGRARIGNKAGRELAATLNAAVL